MGVYIQYILLAPATLLCDSNHMVTDTEFWKSLTVTRSDDRETANTN